MTIQNLLGRFWAFLPPQTPLVCDVVSFKVRLIEAHLSINFPRLSIAKLHQKVKKMIVKNVDVYLKIPLEDPLNSQQELQPPHGKH